MLTEADAGGHSGHRQYWQGAQEAVFFAFIRHYWTLRQRTSVISKESACFDHFYAQLYLVHGHSFKSQNAGYSAHRKEHVAEASIKDTPPRESSHAWHLIQQANPLAGIGMGHHLSMTAPLCIIENSVSYAFGFLDRVGA